MATLSSLANTVDMGAPSIPPGASTNGHKPPAFEDGEEPAPSVYLKYLPAIFSADEFVGRFLRIFQDVLQPVEMMVDNQPYYFDPLTTPKHLLDWMDIWVDMDDEGADWPLSRRRKLIESAAVLYRMRGTAAGIKLHLGIYSGGLVLVEERTNGFRLVPDARLGINTSIGEDRPRLFTVTIAVPDPENLDMDTFRAIIEADKAVDTTYILRVVKMDLKLPKQPAPRW